MRPTLSVDRRLAFGLLTFQAIPYRELSDDVRFLEAIGFDAAWLADQVAPPELPVLEAWTTLAALAADTSRIRIGTLVTNVAIRNPILLARQANTVDAISGGRLELGIGAGYYEGDHRWLGVDFLDGKGRVQRLVETAEILDRALRGGRVTYDGVQHHVDDAPNLAPVQLPRPPIWIAAHATGSMRVTARLAEGVASFGDAGLTSEQTLPIFRDRMARLDEICAAEGRDPGTLRRSYLAGFADEQVFASGDSAADFIGRFAEAGATDFVFTMYNPAEPTMAAGAAAGRYADRAALERLAADTLPHFRT